MRSGFIDEGQCDDFFLEGVPMLYPDVRLSVRCCTRTEQRNWSLKAIHLDNLGNEKAIEKHAAEFLASRIDSWSLDHEPTAENVSRLTPRLRHRILELVIGDSAGDPMPDDSSDSAAAGTIQLQEST